MGQNLIEKLRQKPKSVRNNIAFGIASIFTAFILVVWFSVSTDQFGNIVAGSKSGAGAFSTFISHIKTDVAAVAESLPDNEEIKAAASSTLQEQVSKKISDDAQLRAERASTSATSSVSTKSAIRIATTSSSSSTESSSATTAF